MAKEDLIEFTGVVAELLPNAMFRVKLDNDHDDPRPHLGQDAQEPHPRAGRRPRHRRDDALRPDQGPHHLPLQVGVERPADPAAWSSPPPRRAGSTCCARSASSPPQSIPPISTRRPRPRELPRAYALRMAEAKLARRGRARIPARSCWPPTASWPAAGASCPRPRPRRTRAPASTLLSGRRHRVLGGVAVGAPDGSGAHAAGRDRGALQAARAGRDRRLHRERRMARQGRRLCHPGPRRALRRVHLRLLQQRRRPAALRDGGAR